MSAKSLYDDWIDGTRIMAEVTNELINEGLKAMQVRLGNLEEAQRDIKPELRAMRGHMHAMQVDTDNIYQTVASLEGRLSRIERRLDIIDTPKA